MNGGKRSCVILVADENMAATFRGYFSRPQWHLSLGCAPFDFDPASGCDLIVAANRDPGVFTEADTLLAVYRASHRHVLVALDCEWSGSPGRHAIVAHITGKLVASGWEANSVKVIAIDPELENWLWQDKPLVAEALRYRGAPRLRVLLEQQGLWPADQSKPPRPKEATEWVLKQTRKPRSSAIYEELASRISINGCTDAAFLDLHATLQAWFPVGVVA